MKFRIDQIDTNVSGTIYANDSKTTVKLSQALHATLQVVWDKQEIQIVVPSGFVTDGASVPRWFWWIPGFAPMSRSFVGAVLHDYLYDKACLGYVYVMEYDELVTDAWKVRALTRAECDQVLRLAMAADGENWLVRWTYWSFVRVFAKSHFRK